MIRLAAIMLVICMLAALPAFASNYTLRLGTIFAMYAVMAQSWNIIGGFAGYPSFATAAFFGLGAYTGAILQSQGMPMPLAWIFACVAALIFAICLGAAILHLRGHYFAIASLVVAEVLLEITTSWTDLTGGGMGLNLPILRISIEAQARLFYWSMLFLGAAAFALNAYVSSSRIGFALRCIRQNEDASAMVGINTTFYKVTGFSLSAVLVGGAGAMYASWVFYIEPPDVYSVLTSVKPIVMALIGGAGTLVGPVIGAGIFLVMEEVVWRSFLSIHAGVLGLIIVVLIFFLPNGLLGLTQKWARRTRKEKAERLETRL